MKPIAPAAPYFSPPPPTLEMAAQAAWHRRRREVEDLVGITAVGLPQVSRETLAVLERYVRGELTWAQVLRLQAQRFSKA